MEGFTVIDSQPGHISLAIKKIKGNDNLTRDFVDSLAAIRGIKRVTADSDQGLVEVFYDKNQITSLMSLLALKGTFSKFFPEVNAMKLASYLSESL